MVWKNVSISTERRLCEAGLYGRIALKKPLLMNQNNVKKLQWAKVYKDQTIEQWNKVLWTDESKFKIIGSTRRVYVWWRVGERAATPCISSTIRHRGSSVRIYVRGCQLQSWGYVSGKVQIESDWLSKHTAASRDPIWNTTCGLRIYIHAR